MAGKYQDPKGGLNPAGRKKFGVKKGVTNYSSASDADKRRWVRWALRFTKTPRPLKKPNGEPTRYALMFRAWGEPVPTTVAAVKAVHAKALSRRKALKMGQDAAALEPVAIEELQCANCERVFVREQALFDHLELHLTEDDS